MAEDRLVAVFPATGFRSRGRPSWLGGREETVDLVTAYIIGLDPLVWQRVYRIDEHRYVT